jgi:hypothetical protein
MTLGWLGHVPGAKKTVGLVKRINKTRSSQDFAKLFAESDAGWTELDRLMSNEWCERVWVVQEIATARSRILLCGDEEIECGELVEALARVCSVGLERRVSLMLSWTGVKSSTRSSWRKSKHISSVDLIKLKLALRFRVTRPIEPFFDSSMNDKHPCSIPVSAFLYARDKKI